MMKNWVDFQNMLGSENLHLNDFLQKKKNNEIILIYKFI